jgi:hypothetical protein
MRPFRVDDGQLQIVVEGRRLYRLPIIHRAKLGTPSVGVLILLKGRKTPATYRRTVACATLERVLWEVKMPDMSDPKLIDFKFKGIKSSDDDYDLLGQVKAETFVGALELDDPCAVQASVLADQCRIHS